MTFQTLTVICIALLALSQLLVMLILSSQTKLNKGVGEMWVIQSRINDKICEVITKIITKVEANKKPSKKATKKNEQ